MRSPGKFRGQAEVAQPKDTASITVFRRPICIPHYRSPFVTVIQVIDEEAAGLIDGGAQKLTVGESIIIPAHTRNIIEAKVHFKMISTVIKSSY